MSITKWPAMLLSWGNPSLMSVSCFSNWKCYKLQALTKWKGEKVALATVKELKKKLTNKISSSMLSSKRCMWLQDFAWMQKGFVYSFKIHFFHFEALWIFLSVCPSLLFSSRLFLTLCRLSCLLMMQRTLVICWVQLWEGKGRKEP